MAALILVPAAQTDWIAQGRLAGLTDLPLSEAGHRQALAVGQSLASSAAALVLCGAEEASRQTAAILAHEINVKSRAYDDLRELNIGHWSGLTDDDFRERFGKVYRQWRSDPLSVTPPEGESIREAAVRLFRQLAKSIRRRNEQTLVLVLGAFACAIVRCFVTEPQFATFWEQVDQPPASFSLQLTAAQAKHLMEGALAGSPPAA